MPTLGFGTATLGREIDADTSFRILDAAFEAGIRHFDTAEAYGGGNARATRKATLGIDDVREASGVMHSSELLLGEWIRNRGVRKEITLATKVSSGSRAEDVLQAISRSMERLQVERLDAYYLHSIPKELPLSEPLAALEQACAEGRVLSTGVSNAQLVHLEESRRYSPHLHYCQNPFNLVQYRETLDTLDYCKHHDVQFVAYSPLAAGFLTGKYGPRGEVEVKGTRFDVAPGHQSIYLNERGFEALYRLESASVKTGIPKHLLALAWVLRQQSIAIMLIGATKLHHIEQALEAQQLSLEEEVWESLLPSEESQ
jgi:aryl-alcohol dehydrogenase-like predicted oxidoreductase